MALLVVLCCFPLVLFYWSFSLGRSFSEDFFNENSLLIVLHLSIRHLALHWPVIGRQWQPPGNLPIRESPDAIKIIKMTAFGIVRKMIGELCCFVNSISPKFDDFGCFCENNFGSFCLHCFCETVQVGLNFKLILVVSRSYRNGATRPRVANDLAESNVVAGWRSQCLKLKVWDPNSVW